MSWSAEMGVGGGISSETYTVVVEEEESTSGMILGLTLEVAARVSVGMLTLKPLYFLVLVLRRTSTVEIGAPAVLERRPRVTTVIYMKRVHHDQHII